MKRPEYVFETLQYLGEFYHQMTRAFRSAWRWGEWDVDKLLVRRILKIYDELKEDAEKQSDKEGQ